MQLQFAQWIVDAGIEVDWPLEVHSEGDFVALIKGVRAKMATDLCRECSCPNTNCQWHGDCHACVRQHRFMGEHLPK